MLKERYPLWRPGWKGWGVVPPDKNPNGYYTHGFSFSWMTVARAHPGYYCLRFFGLDVSVYPRRAWRERVKGLIPDTYSGNEQFLRGAFGSWMIILP